MPQLSLHTPFGALTFSEDDGAIVATDWGWGRDQDATTLLTRARKQMNEYLDRERQAFDLPLRLDGSPYQQKVWATLRLIAYGQTLTYAAVAQIAGGSPCSIGQASRCNPVPIIVPCHRVVSTRGLGSSSAVESFNTKRCLLQLESASA